MKSSRWVRLFVLSGVACLLLAAAGCGREPVTWKVNDETRVIGVAALPLSASRGEAR